MRSKTNKTKGDFVCSLPRSLSAKDVQAKAAAKGIEISVAYINNIRSISAKRARETVKGVGTKPLQGDREQQEKHFAQLVFSLGYARCKQLLAQAELALRSAAKRDA